MKSHNFILMKDFVHFTDNRWHCPDCDSIVQYPKKYNQRDINKIMNGSRLRCLPPIVKKNWNYIIFPAIRFWSTTSAGCCPIWRPKFAPMALTGTRRGHILYPARVFRTWRLTRSFLTWRRFILRPIYRRNWFSPLTWLWSCTVRRCYSGTGKK